LRKEGLELESLFSGQEYIDDKRFIIIRVFNWLEKSINAWIKNSILRY
jgi:hypothetical protein